MSLLGASIGSQAFGAGLGLLLGGINNSRQLKQQAKLNEQQLGMNMKMTNYNYDKQKRYEVQVLMP